MKRKYILLLTLLLAQTTLVWGMEPENKESLKSTMATSTSMSTIPSDETRYVPKNQASVEVGKLQDAIQDIKDKIRKKAEQYPNTEKTVIVLGRKGSGKTTLIHGLLGKQLLAEDSPWGRCLVTGYNTAIGPEALQQNTTGGDNRAISNITLLNEPNLRYDEVNKIAYWECPGWDEQLDPEQDIINAWSISYLLETAASKTLQQSSLNVLLTLSELEFEQGASFLSLLNKLIEMFHNDEQLQKCFSLVVTKQQNIDIHKVLPLILKDQQILHTRTKTLLEFLVRKDNHVFTIPRPQKEGEYYFDRKGILQDLETSRNKDELLHEDKSKYYLATLKYHQKDLSFKPIVNFKSQIFINQLANDLNESIADYLKIDIMPSILNSCRLLIDYHLYTLGDLRAIFSNLKEKLLKLQENPEKLAEELETIITSIPYIRDVKSNLRDKILNEEQYFINIKSIRDILDKLNFLKTMKKSEYNPRFIEKAEDLIQVNPGELGLVCENEKLYCKVHNKEKIEIIPSDNPTVGFYSEKFYWLLQNIKFSREMNENEKEKVFQYVFLKGYTRENVVYQTASWFQPLLEMIQKIEHLAKQPQIEFENNILTIEGVLVGMEDVFLAMEKFPDLNINPPKIINFFGLNKFFINEKVNTSSFMVDQRFFTPISYFYKWPFNCIAPHVKVVGKRTFNLTTSEELSNTSSSVYGKASVGESLDQCTFFINEGKEGKLASELIHVDHPNETICPYLMQNSAQGLTPLEIQASVQQLLLESGSLAQEYNQYYFQQAMDPQVAPFMKKFSRPRSYSGGGGSGH